jgi:hypothetical protein
MSSRIASNNAKQEPSTRCVLAVKPLAADSIFCNESSTELQARVQDKSEAGMVHCQIQSGKLHVDIEQQLQLPFCQCPVLRV